jgi:hypothetical protein
MFVTVWLGIFEISTGKLVASNAGHEYPILKKDGKFEIYKDHHGMERMIDALNKDPETDPVQTLKNVRAGVDAFVKDA